MLSIAKVAAYLGTTTYRVRQLEDAGVLPSVRTEGGHRRWKMETVEAARRRNPMPADVIVSRIVRDLTDRRGLRQAWDEIGEDVRDEIVETWRRIVAEAL
jgi:excisionase family DNA binding protein